MSEDRLRTIELKIQALQTMRAELSRLAKQLRRTRGLVCPAPHK
jgi:hypothetical protein